MRLKITIQKQRISNWNKEQIEKQRDKQQPQLQLLQLQKKRERTFPK